MVNLNTKSSSAYVMYATYSLKKQNNNNKNWKKNPGKWTNKTRKKIHSVGDIYISRFSYLEVLKFRRFSKFRSFIPNSTKV